MAPDVGPCLEYNMRWFYNSQSGLCEQFTYGSCGGNTNNFIDKQTCEAKCQSGSFHLTSGLFSYLLTYCYYSYIIISN
ncbi:unnamed protein product [Anisakis simplex]|uniref:BPTI/Kunitz inhibitor domain-containing protein n=1 Tax=Anisakis simplex TaxID=6269 RepID=A0A3P6PE71_ANISI|nr:unnamed protein product [Anisakis simplex]